MEIEINNIKINYISEGTGDTVIILHGWGASIETYRSIINMLSPYMNVIVFDMPGHGKTNEPDEPWCVDDYLDITVKFIEKLGIKKASFICHSFGGRVLIKMCSLHELPFDIDKVVMMDAAGIRPKLSMKKKLRQRRYKIAKWFLSIPLVAWFYPDSLDRLRSKYGSQDYNSATPVMRATLVKVINEDLTDLIHNIKSPTLLIWGDKDTATPFSDAEKMNSLIADSGIVRLPGAGHFSFLEQPQVVRYALHSFFEIKEEL